MSMKNAVIRMADVRDAEAMLAIYSPYVTGTSVTFETEVPSVEDFRGRIERTTGQYPWLVCEVDGTVAGYAYASRHRERAAYQWSVDMSVYVDRQFHRRGIARALYTAIVGLLRRQGYHSAFAGVTSPNPASAAFHRQMGFQIIGVFENDGFKLGEWHGVTWFRLPLLECAGAPEPPRPIGDIESGDILSDALRLTV